MSDANQTGTGIVASLWRYPVKSMRGEELNSVRVSEQGLFGDRAYALLDRADGKVATAKNPRKWPNLFAFRAALTGPSAHNANLRFLRITLPDGTVVSGDRSDVNEVLSEALHRQVTLAAAQADHATEAQSSMSAAGIRQAEEYWPDIEGLDHRETVTDFTLPKGTFFDCATIHLLTTATLDCLRNLYPEGQFDVPRFRPNIVVEPEGGEATFAENSWVGQTLAIGDEVQLSIMEPCGRCAMTTLAQEELPQDANILRTAVRYNQAQVGVYAAVVRGGTIHCGDTVSVRGV